MKVKEEIESEPEVPATSSSSHCMPVQCTSSDEEDWIAQQRKQHGMAVDSEKNESFDMVDLIDGESS